VRCRAEPRAPCVARRSPARGCPRVGAAWPVEAAARRAAAGSCHARVRRPALGARVRLHGAAGSLAAAAARRGGAVAPGRLAALGAMAPKRKKAGSNRRARPVDGHRWPSTGRVRRPLPAFFSCGAFDGQCRPSGCRPLFAPLGRSGPNARACGFGARRCASSALSRLLVCSPASGRRVPLGRPAAAMLPLWPCPSPVCW